VPKFIAMIAIDSVKTGTAAKLELVFKKLGCSATNPNVQQTGPNVIKPFMHVIYECLK
jgi:hypothetical protein